MPSFFIGLKYIPSSKATLIMSMNPILVAILAYFLLKEQMTIGKILAVIGAFFGVLLFTYNKNNSQRDTGSYFIGIAMVTVT